MAAFNKLLGNRISRFASPCPACGAHGCYGAWCDACEVLKLDETDEAQAVAGMAEEVARAAAVVEAAKAEVAAMAREEATAAPASAPAPAPALAPPAPSEPKKARVSVGVAADDQAAHGGSGSGSSSDHHESSWPWAVSPHVVSARSRDDMRAHLRGLAGGDGATSAAAGPSSSTGASTGAAGPSATGASAGAATGASASTAGPSVPRGPVDACVPTEPAAPRLAPGTQAMLHNLRTRINGCMLNGHAVVVAGWSAARNRYIVSLPPDSRTARMIDWEGRLLVRPEVIKVLPPWLASFGAAGEGVPRKLASREGPDGGREVVMTRSDGREIVIRVSGNPGKMPAAIHEQLADALHPAVPRPPNSSAEDGDAQDDSVEEHGGHVVVDVPDATDVEAFEREAAAVLHAATSDGDEGGEGGGGGGGAASSSFAHFFDDDDDDENDVLMAYGAPVDDHGINVNVFAGGAVGFQPEISDDDVEVVEVANDGAAPHGYDIVDLT